MLLIQRAASLFCFIFLILKGVDASGPSTDDLAAADKVLIDLFSAVQESLDKVNDGTVEPEELDYSFNIYDHTIEMLKLYPSPGAVTLGNPVQLTPKGSKGLRALTFRVNGPNKSFGGITVVCKADKCDGLLARLKLFGVNKTTAGRFELPGFIDPTNAKRYTLRADADNGIFVEISGKEFKVFNVKSIFLPLIRKQLEVDRTIAPAGWTATAAEIYQNNIKFTNGFRWEVAMIPLPEGLAPRQAGIFEAGVDFVNVFKKFIFKGESELPSRSTTPKDSDLGLKAATLKRVAIHV